MTISRLSEMIDECLEEPVVYSSEWQEALVLMKVVISEFQQIKERSTTNGTI